MLLFKKCGKFCWGEGIMGDRLALGGFFMFGKGIEIFCNTDKEI
jgi:hypothetical protein